MTALDFQAIKLAIIDGSGLAKDALHIHIGLAIFVIVRLVWRGQGGWWLAWIAALAAALGGEWLDIRAEAAKGAIRPDADHWHDVWNTMLWPTVLLLIGRWMQPRAHAPSGDLADEALEEPPPVNPTVH